LASFLYKHGFRREEVIYVGNKLKMQEEMLVLPTDGWETGRAPVTLTAVRAASAVFLKA
jgi:hypothetical protein